MGSFLSSVTVIFCSSAVYLFLKTSMMLKMPIIPKTSTILKTLAIWLIIQQAQNLWVMLCHPSISRSSNLLYYHLHKSWWWRVFQIKSAILMNNFVRAISPRKWNESTWFLSDVSSIFLLSRAPYSQNEIIDAQLATLRGAPQVLCLGFHLEVSGELSALRCGTLKLSLTVSTWNRVACGKAPSDALWAAVVNLACHFDVDNIAKYTGCKRHTVEHTLADYQRHGVDWVVAREHMFPHLRGARRDLTCRDIRVCLWSWSILVLILTWLVVSRRHRPTQPRYLPWQIAWITGGARWSRILAIFQWLSQTSLECRNTSFQIYFPYFPYVYHIVCLHSLHSFAALCGLLSRMKQNKDASVFLMFVSWRCVYSS